MLNSRIWIDTLSYFATSLPVVAVLAQRLRKKGGGFCFHMVHHLHFLNILPTSEPFHMPEK